VLELLGGMGQLAGMYLRGIVSYDHPDLPRLICSLPSLRHVTASRGSEAGEAVLKALWEQLPNVDIH